MPYINKFGITVSSRPEEYSELLFPLRNKNQGKETMFSFEKICKWTNIKAHLSGAEKDRNCYKEFKDFTMADI